MRSAVRQAAAVPVPARGGPPPGGAFARTPPVAALPSPGALPAPAGHRFERIRIARAAAEPIQRVRGRKRQRPSRELPEDPIEEFTSSEDEAPQEEDPIEEFSDDERDAPRGRPRARPAIRRPLVLRPAPPVVAPPRPAHPPAHLPPPPSHAPSPVLPPPRLPPPPSHAPSPVLPPPRLPPPPSHAPSPVLPPPRLPPPPRVLAPSPAPSPPPVTTSTPPPVEPPAPAPAPVAHVLPPARRHRTHRSSLRVDPQIAREIAARSERGDPPLSPGKGKSGVSWLQGEGRPFPGYHVLSSSKVEVPVEWESGSEDERDPDTVERSFQRARRDLPTPPDRYGPGGRKNFSAQVARTWAHTAEALRDKPGIVDLRVPGDRPYNSSRQGWTGGSFVVVPPAAKRRIRLGEPPEALRERVDPPKRKRPRYLPPPSEHPSKFDEPKPPPRGGGGGGGGLGGQILRSDLEEVV